MQRNMKFLKFNLKTMMLKAASWEKFISERLKAPTSMFTLFKVFVDFAPKNIFIETQDKLFWKVIQFFTHVKSDVSSSMMRPDSIQAL